MELLNSKREGDEPFFAPRQPWKKSWSDFTKNHSGSYATLNGFAAPW